MPAMAQDYRQHSPRWAGLACALVEERRPGAGNGIIAVVCPAPHRLPPPPLRNTACCAVFRTEADAVWMLRTVGHEWTEDRLATAAQVVTRRLGHLPVRRDPLLANRLARALQVPQVQVVEAALDPPEPRQWETRKLALALRLQHLPPGERAPEAAALALEVDEIERELIARLGEALRRFAGALDVEILAAAPDAARDIALYSYLVEPQHRRNRLQFAGAFPLFLRAAADGTGDGALIRRAVDDGVPLVRALAARWAISPSVLRGLRGRQVETIGARWQENIEALVVLLDALPAEFRPAADASAWQAFNERVALAETAFGRRPWTSPLALAWLRQASRGGLVVQAVTDEDRELQRASLAVVDELRQALIEALKAECALPAVEPGVLSTRAWQAADRALAGIGLKRLIILAQRYRRELAAAQAEHARENATAARAGFWPLLPGELLSADRSRLVVPLDDRQALLAHGRAVVNCLGGSHLERYSAACRRGATFILGVLDARSRRPLSTAEVHARRLTLAGRIEVDLVQHTAARNAPPGRACRHAVAEAIALLATQAGQEHLRRGARALAVRRRGDAQLQREFDLLPVRQAVRRSLGERRFDELAAQLRQAPAG